MADTKPPVLNPTLYNAVRRVFGAAYICHANEPLLSRVVTNPRTGYPQLRVDQFGEQYHVICRWCRSKAYTLEINHRYATYDERLSQQLDFLATCTCSGCLASDTRLAELFSLLDGGRGLLGDALIRSNAGQLLPAEKMPQPYSRLFMLPGDHPARVRLERLGFDPDRLARRYAVGFCGDGDELLARQRVVVPVHTAGQFVGWLTLRFKGREIQFLPAPGMWAGRPVYNLDRAREYPIALVVPTPDWVWRLGAAAVSPASAADPAQLATALAAALGAKPLVLVTPPGAEKPGRLAGLLRARLGSSFASVQLPPSAAGADRKILHQLVSTEAEKQGLSVIYKRPDPDAHTVSRPGR